MQSEQENFRLSSKNSVRPSVAAYLERSAKNSNVTAFKNLIILDLCYLERELFQYVEWYWECDMMGVDLFRLQYWECGIIGVDLFRLQY